ncbi:hypothetical protein FUAX_38060 [Fulvitalea axinellae]|uniref:Uncharacterized protein n=1 Tax=Fulvitalea axinellae TaxID=1182444 RepID=A0AAU9D9W1_9BACT|nr:hypothetical protein FUAX_38060 [Fulvitalea axinellae]
MKTRNLLSLLLLFFGFTACQDNGADDAVKDLEKGIPKKVMMDLPRTVSHTAKMEELSRRTFRGASVSNPFEKVNGRIMSQHLREIIGEGDRAGNITKELLAMMSNYKKNGKDSFEYKGKYDNRTKRGVLKKKVSFEGKTWDYELTVTDGGTDKLAVRMLWNGNPTKKALVLIKPFNLDQKAYKSVPKALYRIDYDTKKTAVADETMTVSLTGWIASYRLSTDKLKFTVTRKGDIFEFFGNSNSPNMWIVKQANKGKNYAFAIRCNAKTKIAVAKLGLAPQNLDENKDLLSAYSLYNVYKKELDAKKYPQVEKYLAGMKGASYYKGYTFHSSGDKRPEGFSAQFVDISKLTPFKPKTISDLKIEMAGS